MYQSSKERESEVKLRGKVGATITVSRGPCTQLYTMLVLYTRRKQMKCNANSIDTVL